MKLRRLKLDWPMKLSLGVLLQNEYSEGLEHSTKEDIELISIHISQTQRGGPVADCYDYAYECVWWGPSLKNA